MTATPSDAGGVEHLDVVVVGAGLSGIGAAVHLQTTLPDRLQPAPDPAVAVVALDDVGRTVHRLNGTIDGLRLLSGVRESGGTLWLGSLLGDSVAMLPR